MTYKQIIQNSIELQIFKHLNRVCGDRYSTIDQVVLNKDKNLITFGVAVKVKPFINAPYTNDFQIHGYVDDYGQAVITIISYKRMISTRKDDGSFTEPVPRYSDVTGLAIKGFAFDK